jgi:hypothetical protein
MGPLPVPCMVPSPNEMDGPTPLNVTVRGAFPDVGVAERFPFVPPVTETVTEPSTTAVHAVPEQVGESRAV